MNLPFLTTDIRIPANVRNPHSWPLDIRNCPFLTTRYQSQYEIAIPDHYEIAEIAILDH